MNESGDPNSRRLEQIEATLGDFKDRLSRIEQRLGMARGAEAPPAPPPFARAEGRVSRAEGEFRLPPVQEQEPRRPRIEAVRKPPPAFDISTSPRLGEDAELKFGSVVLPRVGAGVMLLGIGYLVALGITDGWITPVMQFWGAIMLCLASVGIGFWKRQEKFDFGQVLIGLGSCGLYITFACGHVFQNLYTGETLVLQFLALSLANLLYGAVTPSKTFTAIGLIGGMISATLPMREQGVGVSLWLHAAIVLPTAAIIAKHKWREMAIGAWFVSTFALLWPVLEKGPWAGQLSVLYGASLSLLLAYAWAHESWEFDPKAVFIPFAGMLTGFIAFAVGQRHDPGATYHLILFGAALAGSSLIFKKQDVRNASLLAGILVPYVLAPQGLGTLNDAWCYLALGAVAALASLRFAPKAATCLSGLGVGLGLVMYGARLSAASMPISLAEESSFLLAATAVIALAGWTSSRWFKDGQALTLLGMVAASPLLCRLSVIQLGQAGVGASASLSVSTALLALSAGGAILAMSKKWDQLSAFGWTAFVGASLSYMIALGEFGLSVPVEAALLAAGLAVIAVNVLGLGRSSPSIEAQSLVVLGAALVSAPIARLSVILMAEPSIGASAPVAVTIAMLALSAAAAFLALRKDWPLIAGYSWAALGFGVVSYLATFGSTALTGRVEVSLLLAMLAAIVLSAVASGRTWKGADTQSHVLAASVLLSPFVSRLAVLLMGGPTVGASAPVAVAAALLSLSAAGAILSMRRGWVMMAGFSWAGVFASGIAYLIALADGGHAVSYEVPILAAMLTVIVLSGTAAGKTTGAKDAACILAAFMGWGVFSRLVYVVGTQPGGLSGTAAITLAWILYAVVVMVVGFLLDLRSLRLTSLTIFGITLGKIMIYDLAGLDQGVRVVLLILLGAAMISGGYWYIRKTNTAGKPPAVAA